MKNNKAICMLGVLAVSIFLVFNQAIESSEILDESTVSNDPGLDPNPVAVLDA